MPKKSSSERPPEVGPAPPDSPLREVLLSYLIAGPHVVRVRGWATACGDRQRPDLCDVITDAGLRLERVPCATGLSEMDYPRWEAAPTAKVQEAESATAVPTH